MKIMLVLSLIAVELALVTTVLGHIPIQPIQERQILDPLAPLDPIGDLFTGTGGLMPLATPTTSSQDEDEDEDEDEEQSDNGGRQTNQPGPVRTTVQTPQATQRPTRPLPLQTNTDTEQSFRTTLVSSRTSAAVAALSTSETNTPSSSEATTSSATPKPSSTGVSPLGSSSSKSSDGNKVSPAGVAVGTFLGITVLATIAYVIVRRYFPQWLQRFSRKDRNTGSDSGSAGLLGISAFLSRKDSKYVTQAKLRELDEESLVEKYERDQEEAAALNNTSYHGNKRSRYSSAFHDFGHHLTSPFVHSPRGDGADHASSQSFIVRPRLQDPHIVPPPQSVGSPATPYYSPAQSNAAPPTPPKAGLVRNIRSGSQSYQPIDGALASPVASPPSPLPPSLPAARSPPSSVSSHSQTPPIINITPPPAPVQAQDPASPQGQVQMAPVPTSRAVPPLDSPPAPRLKRKTLPPPPPGSAPTAPTVGGDMSSAPTNVSAYPGT